jgi:tetratricopeptide (TPR) repeat protein
MRAPRRPRERNPGATPTSPAEEAPERPGRLWPLAALGLAVLVVLAYLPSLSAGFVYDDQVLIVHDPAPRSLGGALAVFAERHHTAGLPYYRPLSRFTLRLQKLIHGDAPLPFHAFNAALAGLLAAALAALLRWRAFRIPAPAALLAAGLVCLHPAVSSVVYAITGRETLLAAVCVIGAVAAFLRPWPTWLFALPLFALGLLSKEQAIAALPLCLLADLLGLGAEAPGRNWRRWLARHAPLVAIAAGYLLLRAWALSGGPGARLALLDQPAGPALAVLYLLQTAFAPFLELVYEPRPEVWLLPARLAVALGLSALVALAAWRGWRSMRAQVLFFGGWTALALLPVANVLVQETRFDERHVVLPLVGLIGLLAALAGAAWHRRAARVAILVGAGLSCLAAGLASNHRLQFFQDDPTFLGQWARTDPEAAQPQASLGEMHARRGEHAQAAEHYRRAVALRPGRASFRTSLANVLKDRPEGQEEAIREYQEALRLHPDYFDALVNLGVVLKIQGRLDEAVQHQRRALALRPGEPTASLNLANALLAQRRFAEAAEAYRTVLRAEPGRADVHAWLGTCLARLGRGAEARAAYAQALRLDPALDWVRRAREELDAPTTAPAGPASPDDARRAALARALPAETRGTPLWLAVAEHDPGARELAAWVLGALSDAGWRLADRAGVGFPMKPGVFLLAADEPPPAYVSALHEALQSVGLEPVLGTGYRAYAADMRLTRPGWQGFELGPEQTYLLVIGRQPTAP